MLRAIFFSSFVLSAALPVFAEDESPSTSSVDVAVSTDGEKVSGHVGACLISLGDRPLAGFGLTKDFDKKAEYTFFLVFKTGGKKFEGSGSGAEVNSDGKKTSYKITFDVGDVELPLELESERGADQKLISSKAVIGNQTLKDKGPRVVLADLTTEKPTFQVIDVALPESIPDLAKEDSWPATLKQAVEELKNRSPDLKKALEEK